MLEETLITIWASINSWFTPTVLFILLNIVIGTIAVTSGFANQKPQKQNRQEGDLHHHHEHEQQRFHQQLVRAPSNVIQRLKSINLYHFKTEDLNPFSSFSSSHHHDHDHSHVDHRAEIHQDHHHQQPSVIQRLKSINLYSFKAEDLNPFHQDHKLDDQAHAHQQQQQQQQQPPPQSRLARAPSNVIQRLKSINLSDLNPFPSFQQQPPPQLENIIDHHRIQKKTKTPIRKQREISPQNPHDDEFDHDHHPHHHQEVHRSNSDRRPAAKLLVSQKEVIKKSMSAKLDFWDFGNREEEETEEVVVVRRRPSSTTTVKVIKETTKTTKASESERFGDEEVDAKADDFINKFKHQLKLQRLDSIMRSKDDLLLLAKDGKNINL